MTKLGEKLLAAFLLDKGVIKDESHFQAWYEGARNGPPEGQTEYRNAVDGANRHWQQFERDGRLPFMLGTCRISFEWRKVHIQQARWRPLLPPGFGRYRGVRHLRVGTGDFHEEPAQLGRVL